MKETIQKNGRLEAWKLTQEVLEKNGVTLGLTPCQIVKINEEVGYAHIKFSGLTGSVMVPIEALSKMNAT